MDANDQAQVTKSETSMEAPGCGNIWSPPGLPTQRKCWKSGTWSHDLAPYIISVLSADCPSPSCKALHLLHFLSCHGVSLPGNCYYQKLYKFFSIWLISVTLHWNVSANISRNTASFVHCSMPRAEKETCMSQECWIIYLTSGLTWASEQNAQRPILWEPGCKFAKGTFGVDKGMELYMLAFLFPFPSCFLFLTFAVVSNLG